MKNVYMLTKMQYPRAAAAEALKQTNNDVGRALDVRLLNPSLPYLQKILGWEVHARAYKTVFFWSYNILCIFMNICSHANSNIKKKTKRLTDFKFTILLIVFQRHTGSERVKQKS